MFRVPTTSGFGWEDSFDSTIAGEEVMVVNGFLKDVLIAVDVWLASLSTSRSVQNVVSGDRSFCSVLGDTSDRPVSVGSGGHSVLTDRKEPPRDPGYLPCIPELR